jgi:hypothetical protein
MRSKFLYYSLMVILLLQSSVGYVTALGDAEASSNENLHETEKPVFAPDLTVSLKAATGKSIIFKPETQETEIKSGSSNDQVPHLILNRNGVLTPRSERTLIISVDNLVVPTSGLYVQLVLETQHGDPDLDRRNNIRIRVYKDIRFIPYDGLTQQGANVQFNITFDPITILPHKTIKTPTDYYRYRVTVSDALGNQLQTYVDDYAFLLENQWRVPLPEALEMTPGAAPEELLIYYYDMIPFQSNLRDPDSQIPRQEVDIYIQTELIPAMVQAFWQQSNIWGFPWYEEWHNFRSDEDPKTLSVALSERNVWFHGESPSLGHSMISIRVDGTTGEYRNLIDGLMSTFHHELFHNQQRNMSLHFGSQGYISGQEDAWKLFSEGTAVLASSVGQPAVQFEATPQSRSYLKRANAFIGSEGAIGGGLNQSYKEIPYHTALYWRFLYENCGGSSERGEDPATGMQVIHHALEALYKGEIVQINSSTEVAKALPLILDHALQSTPSCAFRSYEESLVHFARAIYLLRLEDGRCSSSSHGPNCGFIDPHQVYARPPVDRYSITSDNVTEIGGAIPSSYGIDLIELELSPSVESKRLKLIFTSNSNQNLAFHIEVLKTRCGNEQEGSEHRSIQVDIPISVDMDNGYTTIEIENLSRDDLDGVGLILTRMDPYEAIETTGAYLIQVSVE